MSEWARMAKRAVADLPVCDLHTHLYDPAIGAPCLSGIDELLTYHYLVAELFAARPDEDIEAFWRLPRPARADRIWKELFVERAPISESCRGVVQTLQALGLDPRAKTLADARSFFAGIPLERRVDRAFELAGLTAAHMTNDPLDPAERPAWERGFERDPRFLAVLRLDSALMRWPEPVAGLRELGYEADDSLSGRTMEQIRRYLRDWTGRLDARYLAISLPPSFRYPAEESPLANLLVKAVFPVAGERGLPVALMIGVRKLANPALRLAGDSVGKGDIESVEALARDFPKLRFLVTMLSRENQHELCVAARKFGNLRVFGCWWFLNNPTFIREMTAMRLELLGLSFVAQHSDARVLEQVIYKWARARELIGEVLAARCEDLARAGWTPREEEIRRDAARILDGTVARAAP